MVRTGAWPRLVEGLLLQPDARGENGGVWGFARSIGRLGGWSGFRSEVGWFAG